MNALAAMILSLIVLGSGGLVFAHPGTGIVIADDGTIYFAYGPGHRIWKVTPDGAASELVVGRIDSDFRVPHCVVPDGEGNILTASDVRSVVWRIRPDGSKTTIYPPDNWDGVGTVGLGGDPFTLAPDGRILSILGDQPDAFSRLVLISLDGKVTPLAGEARGFADGQGEEARFGYLTLSSFAWGPDGSLYLTDEGRAMRRVTMQGNVTTIAGGAEQGMRDAKGAEARFQGAAGLTVAPEGTIYVADAAAHRIRRIAPDGEVTTIAGTGERGSADGPGDEASFDEPFGVTRAEDGTLYILEYAFGPAGEFVRIRRIDADHSVTTHAIIDAERIAG